MMRRYSTFFDVRWNDDVLVVTLRDHEYTPREASNEIRITSLADADTQQPIPFPERFRGDLLGCLKAERPTKVIIDHAGVKTIGSSYIVSTPMNNVFAMTAKVARSWGCQIRFCRVPDLNREVYEMYLVTLLPIHDSEAEALVAFE